MAFLLKYTKNVLLELAEEFGVSGLTDKSRKLEIKEAIEKSANYDEGVAKELIEGILEEKEREKLEAERNFELEKLKIQSLAETSSVGSGSLVQDAVSRKTNLKDIVPKFDPKQLDISLFFTIFERLARKENVREQDWVSQLIPLLPSDVVQIIMKLDESEADNFHHVKRVLMNRFKLSARALRMKFKSHNKKSEELWIDLVHDLRGYLDNWLETLEIKDLESLKELMLTEQLKKRVPLEIKQHFLDVWEESNKALELAEKCDKYDAVRREKGKGEYKPFQRFTKGRNSWGKETQKFGLGKQNVGSTPKIELAKDKKDVGKYKGDKTDSKDHEFDKTRKIICYMCAESGHIRPNCPQNPNRRTNPIHHLSAGKILGVGFEPYIGKLEINGQEREFLRDSGSNIDVCESNMISVDDLLPENVWIKQPFDETCRCLPLAKIVLKGEFGEVITKAAVKPANLSQGIYLLGNKTAELIEASKKTVYPINAITRSQKREQERMQNAQSEKNNEKPTQEKIQNFEEEQSLMSESLEEISAENKGVLPVLKDADRCPLIGVSAKDFQKEQTACDTLKKCWEKANKEAGKEFKIENGRLIRISDSKRNQSRMQLCVPKKFRAAILNLCHDSVSGHLGSCKTKQRVLTNFFWPNCYQEVEEYVKTCEICQKVGQKGDKKKAPLKIVPIISETFRRLSIDAIGPLITSNKNNRFAITAVCVASKFPDAIPVENLTSRSVINALMQIFAKTGFPRELVCDQGAYFTSDLSTAFFKKYDIKISYASVCHPQSNQVERMHSTLKRILKALCLESKSDWEENLPMALFALRTVPHESTGFSPSELIFGKNLRMPHTIVYENWMQEEEMNQNVVEYILDLNERLKRCQDLAGERMTECQQKRKLWYDQNAVSRKFKVGDPVLVLATAKPHKMAVQWLGPGVVTGVISDTNYTVDLPGRRCKDTIFHVNLMKPYHKRPEYVNLILEDEAEEIEEDASIPYPISDPNHFDLTELIKGSNLEKRVSEKNLTTLQEVLVKHKTVFSNDPGTTHKVEMDIILTDDKPIRAKPYRMSPRQLEIMRKEISRLLELGVIEVGQSDYASPMILVESPGKDPRPCVDYRALNAKTQVQFFPLPNIEEVVEEVSTAEYISVMDLTKGYFQIPLTKRAQRYAAFVTPFGEFIPKKMMFGLLNAPFYFCKLISEVLGDLVSFVRPYVDDLAVFSSSWELHIRHLDIVLQRLEEANLKVKPAKCVFAQNHVKFLGHEVGSGKRSPSDAKIQTIQEFPIPKTKTHVRSFLGLTGFYYKYIKDYATKAAPLTDLLKGKNKKEKIEWSQECNQAFNALKLDLTKRPVLYAADFSKDFIVQTDASLVGAGVVLAQNFGNNEEHPIVYLSKKFSKTERNYSTIERELAAVIFGVKKLNHYLDGQRFVLQTDHNPLVYLKKMMGTNSRLTRWALCLQQYNYTVEHKSGKKHLNADALSRIHEE